MTFYFVDPVRGPVGPCSLDDLRRLYEAGVITLDTRITTQEGEASIPFHSLWEQVETSRPSPPPLNPTSPPPPPNDALNDQGSAHGFAKRAGSDFEVMLPHLTLPLDEIRSFRWVENRRALAIAAVGLLPLVIYALFNDPSQLANAFWAMALYFSTMWAFFFYYAFPTPEARVGTAALCFFTTSVISVSVLLLAYRVWPLTEFAKWIQTGSPLLVWPGFVLGVGIPEELCKAFVLLILIRRLGPFRPHTVLFYGLISGLGFGIFEGVKYQTDQNFDFAIRTSGQVDAYFAAQYYLLNLIRLTTLPFLHAIWTGTAGYFIGFAAQFPERKRGLLLVAIGLPAVLHGTYNAFGGVLGLTVALVSVLTLSLYLKKSVEFERLLARPQ